MTEQNYGKNRKSIKNKSKKLIKQKQRNNRINKAYSGCIKNMDKIYKSDKIHLEKRIEEY